MKTSEYILYTVAVLAGLTVGNCITYNKGFERGLEKGLHDGREQMKSAVIVTLQERVQRLDRELQMNGNTPSCKKENIDLNSKKDSLWDVLHSLFEQNDVDYFAESHAPRDDLEK